jgi:putative transposase
VGPNPTDRAKNGVKKSLITEAAGGPLGIVVAGANVPDAQLLDATIQAIVVERPPIEEGYEQHLCLDKGFDNEPGWGACIEHDYIPHIALIRDERPPRSYEHKPRRWVVERTLAWLTCYRGILIRWEKKAANYLALLHFACAWITYRACDLLG